MLPHLYHAVLRFLYSGALQYIDKEDNQVDRTLQHVPVQQSLNADPTVKMPFECKNCKLPSQLSFFTRIHVYETTRGGMLF